MQRSNSMHLTLEAELLLSTPTAAQAYPGSAPGNRQNVGSLPKNLSMSALDLDLQLSYELDHNDKKKQSKFRPEHAVHLIPVIIFVCGLILWIAQAEPAVHPQTEIRGGISADLHSTVPVVDAVIDPLTSKNSVIRQKSSGTFGAFSIFSRPHVDAAKVDIAR